MIINHLGTWAAKHVDAKSKKRWFLYSDLVYLYIYIYLNPPRVWKFEPLNTTKNRLGGWNLTPLEGLGIHIYIYTLYIYIYTLYIYTYISCIQWNGDKEIILLGWPFHAKNQKTQKLIHPVILRIMGFQIAPHLVGKAPSSWRPLSVPNITG